MLLIYYCYIKLTKQLIQNSEFKNVIVNFSSVLINAIDCVREVATDACGAEAADHQVTKEKLFIQPLAREIKCDLDPEKGVIIGWLATSGREKSNRIFSKMYSNWIRCNIF